MARTLFAAAAVALSLVTAFACSSSSSSSSSSSGQTVRAQCTDITQALCKRWIDTCGVTGQGTSADCTTAGASACCASSCEAAAISDPAAIHVCQSDIEATPCTTLWDGTALHTPPSCKGVVKRAASEREAPGQSELGATLSSVQE